VDPGSVAQVKVEVNDLQKLYDGTVDAWLGYAQDEPIKATIAGHPVTNIFPADFGVGGYEGLIIATQSTIDSSPETVKAFVQASEQGWRYAIEHPDEAAQILTTWAKDTSLDFQKLAVRAGPLVDAPQFRSAGSTRRGATDGRRLRLEHLVPRFSPMLVTGPSATGIAKPVM
jgi:ABC-type nitrate/sulfonate/bicarbonate transport system substrate-binding protein